MPKKKLLTAAALTAALAAGGAGGALLGQPLVSGAQQGDDTTTTGAPADEGGRFHRGGPHPGLDAAAEALGITAEELRDALHDGRTIAEVAGDRGVDVQVVIDAMVAEATERIDDRVADGDLDADRAAEIEADLAERITDVVNGEAPLGGPHHHGTGVRLAGLEAAAEVLGMEVADVRDALSDRTIADLAEERGVDLQEVIDAMVADGTERIDEWAAEAKEELPERITDLVNGEGPSGGERRPGRGFGPGPGFGPGD